MNSRTNACGIAVAEETTHHHAKDATWYLATVTAAAIWACRPQLPQGMVQLLHVLAENMN
jgi:hypothetical protein